MIRKSIPASLRQAVWIKHNGPRFLAKCKVSWCENEITPFTFEAGHNQPHSRGGATNLDNLSPICTICNRSMGDRFTIDEYSKKFAPKLVPVYTTFWSRFLKRFKKLKKQDS